jgi:large subunit ribosomal protein L2
MFLKKRKPITPSQRNLIQINNFNLLKKPLLKKAVKGIKNSNGRNNTGKITVRHKGGGHKHKYRIINFNRTNESTGIICSIEYDPNRNSNISSVFDISSKTFFYIITPKNLRVGDIIKSGSNIEPKLGYSLPISEIPLGSLLNNVSSRVNKPAKFARSAGAFAFIKEKTLTGAVIELNSGKTISVTSECYATIGILSNELFFLTRRGKAGRSRWLNVRPTVRGVAMNPVDHPHGGGEGKKSGKGKTPWGKPVKHGLNSKKRKVNIHKQYG